MKGLNKIFRRKKKPDNNEGRNAVSAPPKSALKNHSTNPNTGVPNQRLAKNSSRTSSQTTASGPQTTAPGPQTTEKPPTKQAVATASNPTPAAPERPPQEPKSQTNGRTPAKARETVPQHTQNPPKTEESSAANGGSQNSTEEEDSQQQSEKEKHKGVSESFKGLSATQRFDVAEMEADPNIISKLGAAYESIPLLEQTKLPRGGISMETKAVGRVQFGIPPETIKDSMRLGVAVPQVYIVPAERFCREMGPTLGVNLAEFEFPAYFNFFVFKKRCTLVVDSQEAQDNIVRVFSETLLGPPQFRGENPIPFEEEDFAPDFNKEAIPNLQKELEHFRKLPDGSELTVEKLLAFTQFKQPGDGYCHENLGVPPGIGDGASEDDDEVDEEELDAALGLVGDDEEGEEEEEVPKDFQGVEKRERSKWSYKKARWVGDVATVWPTNATEEEKRDRKVPRVEIFKMPSGTEYIIHDIDVDNQIIGKARFSGHVKVSESMSVEGFVGKETAKNSKGASNSKDGSNGQSDDDSVNSADLKTSLLMQPTPPTFCPPSFGVTVLGNSNGFDKSGSVSGYVLWINGRGVMIDPPPYSSATLEREGIRPRTIVGIILTHCHADHDAGAFQKVLTGSPVVVITTPTIYKSFIRKYAALASLSPALLRHSHRHKPAIIGEPLRFQGATFKFTYSLHAIPCVGFRVEWRGRSMVFTGDHMNKPDELDRLQSTGVLSKARADDLRNLPLQETDLLLHEAGPPPIHTPLEVLVKLPQRVKKRLYVVHTSQIPPEFDELRVAPTGTAGTLRLDQLQRGGTPGAGIVTSTWMERSMMKQRSTRDAYSLSLEEDEIISSPWSSASNEYGGISEDTAPPEDLGDPRMNSSFTNFPPAADTRKTHHRNSLIGVGGTSVPLVSLRPASSTDAWFILNLLSAVPFLSSLSYSSTMEVLETARVDAKCRNDVVVEAHRRSDLLCVVWEGTCVERDMSQSRRSPPQKNLSTIAEQGSLDKGGAVWHAGDWTGPLALQPDKRLSGESDHSSTHDIVAMSSEGVKVITIDFPSLHRILKSGSSLYRKYLDHRKQQKHRLSLEVASQPSGGSTTTHKLLQEALSTLNVLELLDQNSAFRKLTAVQKRHLECLAEGPIVFGPGERLWRSGAPVDRAFLVVSGTASFVPRRRNAGSASVPSGHLAVSQTPKNTLPRLGDVADQDSSSVGEEMKKDVVQAVEEMGDTIEEPSEEMSKPENQIQLEALFSRAGDGLSRPTSEAHDFAKLSKNLQKRAELVSGVGPSDESVGSSQADSVFSEDSDHFGDGGSRDRRPSIRRRRSSRARFANKVLGRLYSRRAFTGGLVFSRGHFLGDISKIVAGLLSSDHVDRGSSVQDRSFPSYGFGEKVEGARDIDPMSEDLTDMVIQEQEGDNNIAHTSTLTAGKDGCIVLVFPKKSLTPFLDEYPGLLLSLLGTQVVV